MEQLIIRTNLERVSRGIEPLIVSDSLTNSAKLKREDMKRYKYWNHVSTTGVKWYSFISGYTFMGENLAINFKTEKSTIKGLMHSKYHRENILDKDFKEIGVAVDCKNNSVIQLFGAK
jgi:uncharacterized protein YkwD